MPAKHRMLAAFVLVPFLALNGNAPSSLGDDLHEPESKLGTPVLFTSVAVFVNSKQVPLAAYQFELVGRNADVKIVGLEGSQHPAFDDPPYYDPTAMMGNRVIAAAFSTKPEADLPRGRVRIAPVHVQVTGAAEPRFEVKLTAAADADAQKITAEIDLVKGNR